MSVLICFSSSPEDVLMIQNRLYEVFIEKVVERIKGDDELIERLRLSAIFHGLDLETERKVNGEKASKLCRALRQTALGIIDGSVKLSLDQLNDSDFRNSCQEMFSNLVARIDKLAWS